jgi:hypothetical protein
MSELPGYLTEAEAAAILRKSPRTMKDYRVRGGGPRFLRAGRTPLYTEADLRAWLQRPKMVQIEIDDMGMVSVAKNSIRILFDEDRNFAAEITLHGQVYPLAFNLDDQSRIMDAVLWKSDLPERLGVRRCDSN